MTYDHTQRSPLFLILFALAILPNFIWLFARPDPTGVLLVAGITTILIFFAVCFEHLRVRDEGDRLAIRFGPLPVFRRLIPFAQITAAEAGRSWFLDGWGIHYMPGRGWIYNLWGFDCVVLHLGERGKVVRIGTDDVAGLVGFLNARIAGRPG